MNTPLVSFVLPTRNRHQSLLHTVLSIGSLAGHVGEVLVVDNASDPPVRLPKRLLNGWALQVIRLEENRGAAARNAAVEQARAEWVCMLDDDSYPVHSGYVDAIGDADAETAAIAGEILLPDGTHEAGGLPEVFVGCGALIRRKAMLDVGGYDPTFEYYVEEYDLAARLLLVGRRIAWDRRLCVQHEKIAAGRDFGDIVRRLIRNNGWVLQRYAPDDVRDELMQRMIERYRAIARKENAEAGAEEGIVELAATVEDQPLRSMPRDLHDRFVGIAAVREYLPGELRRLGVRSVRLVSAGKSSEIVEQVLGESNVAVRPDESADADVIATLSPGPIFDALKACESSGRVVLPPWPVAPVEVLAC
ncbi:MAG: glycosyltransferase [Phycisphaerales bacterium]|nr:glycosyltransferase [Phycisphaerales bacterium]